MAGVRIFFNNAQQVGEKFAGSVRDYGEKVVAAAEATAEYVAEEIETRGGANVANAGRFGQRWMPVAKVHQSGQNVFEVSVTVGTPLFWVFQNGMTIKGNPLLWIPIGGGDGQPSGGRVFFTKNKAGLPLMMESDGKTAKVLRFGKEQVVEPKKFRVIEIIHEVAERMPSVFRSRMKNDE